MKNKTVKKEFLKFANLLEEATAERAMPYQTFGIWLSDDAEVWAFEWLIGADIKIRSFGGTNSRRGNAESNVWNMTFGQCRSVGIWMTNWAGEGRYSNI